MPRRKERIAVVFDTNILIAFYLSRNLKSAVRKIFGLWRIHRKLQLIVSEETVAEYLEILERVNIPQKRIDTFLERIEKRVTVTKVLLGKIPTESRDVDNNIRIGNRTRRQSGFSDNQRQRPFGYCRSGQKEIQVSDCYAD